MRIQRLRVDAFGRLRDLDTGPEALPGLVAVLGPNEAGKSTLFHLLTTLLYGFYPASRDRNPYAPWSGGDASGSAVLRLDGGGCVEVQRRLRSQPTGTLITDGREEELRNRTLPWVEHVPLKVFEQVFAVSLGELAGLESTTWEQIQDRLIGTMGAADLRSARAVAEELEAEAGELWRPTRRGNQRIRDLRDQVAELRDRRRQALENDRRLRQAVAARDQARARLEQAREERHRQRAVLERVEELQPLRLQLRRLDELRSQAGDAEELRDLPADPQAELDRLDRALSEAEERAKEVERAREEPALALEAHGADAARILDHRQEAASLLSRVAAAAPERTRIEALAQEIRDLDRRLDGQAAGILAVPWSEAPSGPLHALPVGDLRSRLRELVHAREDRRVAEAAVRPAAGPEAAAEPRASTRARLAAALALLGGLWLAVSGGISGQWGVAATGALVAVTGFLLLREFDRPHRKRDTAADTPAPALPPAEVVAAAEAETRAHQEVRVLLRDLPVERSVLDEPDEALAHALERLQELVRDRRDRERTLAELRESVARVDRDLRTLAALLERDAERDPQELAALLDRDLRSAERSAEAAEAARRELDRLERTGARAEEEVRRLRSEREALRAALAALGDGDPHQGAARVLDRRRAAERARELDDDIRRRHPDLASARARIEEAERRGEPWTLDADDVARIRARIDALSEEVEELVRESEALEAEVAHLSEGETADAVDGAVATLEEEETRLIQERDRRWVLAQLVREADRRFRERHQPDVLRRAGSHLAHLTGGRYDRILVDESRDEGLFHLSGSAVDAPVPLASPLSTGTLEQAWLALRLAIVDHLDQGQERLPLVLDEVLVNWDATRRARGMDALAALAETRQVFLFTCHPAMAEALAARGARVLEIQGR